MLQSQSTQQVLLQAMALAMEWHTIWSRLGELFLGCQPGLRSPGTPTKWQGIDACSPIDLFALPWFATSGGQGVAD
ncbi:hypothetical protein [Comamonas testosteroni]|uniref:hypothetical protein n=1 Tax=Comamonas testosteroni TaxID=285 RepID=UPI0005B3E331|nr:hypothetical protein [Comamonas testosteroni]